MKIETVSNPSIPGVNGAKTSSPTLDAARAKAIAMIQGQAQSTPVQNPNQVSPEEFGAIRQQSSQRQAPSSEATGSPVESTAPVESAPSTETPSEPLSSQYAALARRERAMRVQAQQIKSREAALAAREAAAAHKAPEAPAFDPKKYVSKEDLAKDPFAYLNEVGVTYDKLTQDAMNQPSAEQMQQMQYMKKLEAKIAELEEGQNSAKKNFEDQQQESYKQAVGQIRSDVRSLVTSDPAFETIKVTGSVNDVVELIEETFKRDGILLSAEEAAIEVENYLVEEALKLSRISKIQQKLAGQSSAQKQSQAPQAGAKPSNPGMRTLTNAVGAARQLSARERALLAFKGELKE